MKSRFATGVIVGVLAVGLAGCTGGAPEPSPTPSPPFASADAAYKAAEATYRGYVEALNQVDLSEPQTFKSVYAWTLGNARKTEEEELTAMSSKGWKVSGDSVVSLAERVAGGNPMWGDVQLATCLDVSKVAVTDSEGVSQLASDRPDQQSMTVDFHRDASTKTGLKISEIVFRNGEPSCGP